MTTQLKSIRVTDFRSIRGTITVPLDAPVVLIHGQNGAGKTSLLSAIELGLTGHVPSLSRLDPDYAQHLIHKEVRESRIFLKATGTNHRTGETEIIVTPGGINGTGLLSRERAQFYSERCFLAQATLGRLLELYEDKDARSSDSPLTKFVKDLLGLDHLDALIDGLHDAGDVRRLRSSVPTYWEARETLPAVEAQIHRGKAEIAEIDKAVQELTKQIYTLWPSLGQTTPKGGSANLVQELRRQSEEPELQRLARLRRDINAIREQWQVVESAVSPAERREAEQAATTADRQLNHWRESGGRQLAVVMDGLREFFPDLPSISVTGPEHARSEAIKAVGVELQRCMTVLASDEQDAGRVAALDQDLSRSRARAAVIDQQLSNQYTESDSLARALSAMLAHIHSDNCPVCDRDFREASDRPLHAHVSDRIAALTESAGRIQALSRESVTTASLLATAERERLALAGRQLDPSTRDQLKTRRARLAELQQALDSLAAVSSEGQQLISLSASSSRILGEVRSRDQRAAMARESANQLAIELALEPLSAAESVDSALDRCQARVSNQGDEVHIAQFAALLRTLSKGLGRQVIVAVHERPLFDYLSLELSPAFPNDRLITIELGRNANGATVMKYEPIVWQPDTAISA